MLIATVIFGGATNRAAAENIINLATGLANKSSNLITLKDPYWDVNSNESPGTFQDALSVFPGDPDWFGGWKPNGPHSNWIARDPNNSGANATGLYMRVFDLTGLNLRDVKIAGAWAIDDSGILSLNGNVISALSAGHWGSLTPFSAPTEFLNPGRNILTVTMAQTDRYLEGCGSKVR